MTVPDGATVKDDTRSPKGRRLTGVKAATDLLTLFVGQFASKIIAFLAFVYLARQLTPANYGVVETVVSMASIGIMAIEFGSGTMGIRQITSSSRSVRDVIHAVVSSRIIIAFAIVPLLVFGYALLMGANAPTALLVLFGFSMLAGVVKHDWLFQAHDRMALSTGGIAVKAAVFLLFVVLLSPGANGVEMVGYAELAAMAAMAAYFLIARMLTYRMEPRLPDLREGMRFLADSAPLGLSGFVYTIATSMPLLIIATMAGAAEAGEFGAGFRIVISLVAFSWIYYQNLFPLLSRHISREPMLAQKLLRASDTCILWAGTALAVTLSIGAAPLIHLTFGENLSGASREFAVAIFYLPLTLASGSVRWLLIAQDRHRAVLATQTIGMVVTLLATAALANLLGGLGGAIGLLVGGLSTYLSAYAVARTGAVVPSMAPMIAPALAGGVVMATAFWCDYPPALEAAVAAVVMAIAALATPGFLGACLRLIKSKQDH